MISVSPRKDTVMVRGSYSKVISILLICLISLTLSAQVMSELPEDFGGSQKDSWPEYKGMNVAEVAELLDSGNFVFVQYPDSFMSRPRPAEPVDLTQDIWLYPYYDGQVVIIPKRGLEHHSPVSGWEELVGVDWVEAKDAILREIIGVLVVYGPDGFPRDRSINLNRVFLDVGPDGKVTKAPKLG